MTVNYETNTGRRFISKGKTAYKIALPSPDRKRVYFSVGHIKLGEKKALRRAVTLRNEQGKELWGKYWRRVLDDHRFITRLPHTLEPVLITVQRGNFSKTDNGYFIECYQAMWTDAKGKRHCRKYSTSKHGKLAAYAKAKRAMLEGYRDYIDVMMYMGIVNTIDLL